MNLIATVCIGAPSHNPSGGGLGGGGSCTYVVASARHLPMPYGSCCSVWARAPHVVAVKHLVRFVGDCHREIVEEVRCI